jgi:hypothetical protein
MVTMNISLDERLVDELNEVRARARHPAARAVRVDVNRVDARGLHSA